MVKEQCLKITKLALEAFDNLYASYNHERGDKTQHNNAIFLRIQQLNKTDENSRPYDPLYNA